MSVGTRALDAGGVPVRLFYPTRATTRPEAFGPYTVDVAIDAPLDGEGHPHVVISHGGTSSPWVLRELAIHLVREGYVVALPTHPGDNRDDRSLFGTVANLEQRPRHLRQVLDALGVERVAVIGHSMGGYTALAVAGGQPVALPNQTADGRAHPVPVVRDPRVRALVLLAPATAWFMGPGALDGVAVPVQLWTGDLDAMAPEGVTQIVLRGVRGVDHRRVPNAGHFAFVSPFPAAMISPSFPPSQDPPGFDRAAFQPVLHAAIAAFLRSPRVLADLDNVED